MNERQWHGKFTWDRYFAACEWLAEKKKNYRKLRLWSSACCRRLGGLLTDKRSWEAIETAERYADGLADKGDVKEAREAAARVPQVREKIHGTPAEMAARAVRFLLHPSVADFAQTAAIRASITLDESGVTKRDAEDRLQYGLLHDIFGNPFHPVALNAAWLTWNDAAVARLAQSAYEERHAPDGTLDNGRLAVLADALEESGCADQDILNHLRGPGPHVRGCWVVDLLLGKS